MAAYGDGCHASDELPRLSDQLAFDHRLAVKLLIAVKTPRGVPIHGLPYQRTTLLSILYTVVCSIQASLSERPVSNDVARWCEVNHHSLAYVEI